MRSVLQATQRLFVLGFSTTGGGHERLTAVLTEHLRGEEDLAGVTLLISMPEPWKGEMLSDGSVPQETGLLLGNLVYVITMGICSKQYVRFLLYSTLAQVP